MAGFAGWSKKTGSQEFFVSRVDMAVDRKLESIGTPDALALRGKIAIANAKRVYRRFSHVRSIAKLGGR